MYDATGDVRFRVELDSFLDIAPVGGELWALAPGRLTRLSARDGSVVGSAPIDYLAPGGRFLQSSTAPQLPVWHCAEPVVVRAAPAGVEVPGPGGEMILPIAENRWLLWHAGQLRLWRTTIGEAWRRQVGDPGSRAIDSQVILDGRLYVLVQQRGTPTDGPEGAELRVTVAQVSDGVQNTQLRLPAVTQLVIAARRGIALAHTGDRLSVIDLRFGRWIRDLAVPEGTLELAVDEGLQHVALGNAGGLELVRIDALSAPPITTGAATAGIAEATPAPTNGASHGVAVEVVAPGPPLPAEPGAATAGPVPEATNDATNDATNEATNEATIRTFGDAPLVRLDPVTATPTATAQQIARVDRAAARAVRCARRRVDRRGLGHRPDRQARSDPATVRRRGRRPSAAHQRAAARRAGERDRPAALDRGARDQRRCAREPHLTPLDVLAIDCALSPTAVAILFAILAPRLRGELARLYGILADDPGRPLVDEHLLGQLLGQLGGGDPAQIARELDGDRPLRRYGLVQVGDRRAPVRRAVGRSAGRALRRELRSRGRARSAPGRARRRSRARRSAAAARAGRQGAGLPRRVARRRAGPHRRARPHRLRPPHPARVARRPGRPFARHHRSVDDAARREPAARGARGHAAPREAARPGALHRRPRAGRRR